MSFWHKIKITTADKWFSLYIRFRDNWTCVNCGKYCMQRKLNNPDLPQTPLDCSHVFSRGDKGARFDERGAYTHCKKCHEYFEKNKREYQEWCEKKLGPVEFQKLLVAAKIAAPHWTRLPDREIAKIYRESVMMIAKKQGKLWIVK